MGCLWAAYWVSRNRSYPDNGRLHIFVPDLCKSGGRSEATSSSMGVCGSVVLVYGRLYLRRPLSWGFVLPCSRGRVLRPTFFSGRRGHLR